MDAKKFKETYLQWSKVVIIAVAFILNAIVMCDHFLGFDFSKNMYMMCFISTGFVLAFLSITWISVLNLEGRFMKSWSTRVIDEEITLQDIADCVKNEGYLPEIDEENHAVVFKIQGEIHRITFNESRFCLYKHYTVKEDVTDIDILNQAIAPTHESVFGIKVYYREYEDGTKGIIFQFASLFSSMSEIQHHFTRCINIINTAVDFHRETYKELEEKKKNNSIEIAHDTRVLS